jgi:hypothetical protein
MVREMPAACRISTEPSLVIYPNPSTGGDVFFAVDNVLPEATAATVEIQDELGRVVLSRTVTVEDGAPVQLLTAGGTLPPGLYLMRLQAGDVVLTERALVR